MECRDYIKRSILRLVEGWEKNEEPKASISVPNSVSAFIWAV